MDLPKTILVPTDFSECAQEALDYGLKLAARLEANVCIVHAYLLPVAGWEGAWAFPQDVITQLEGAARAKLETTLSKAREQLPKTTASFYNGDPREGVPKLAADLKADLIVIGTHGRRGLSRAILGSVTESIIRRAPCAVLAVRHPKDD
jgi:nucleotide-binding universal stress UspA family protein